MIRHPFAETQLSPQFVVESGEGQSGYDSLAARYVMAADAIAGVVISNPMCTPLKADKDPDRRYAVNWRMDGHLIDGQFDFATRVAIEVYGGPDHKRPTVLTDTRYAPSERWKYLAGDMGRTGLYALNIEARTVDLELMEPEETMYDARDHAKFFAKFLGDKELRLKADPQGGEPLCFGPLRPFQDILDTACDNFLGRHSLDFVPSGVRQAFTTAVVADQRTPDYTPGSLASYRQLSPNVHNASDRIKRLADALYATNDETINSKLLTQLLDPGIAEVAALARHDSNQYYLLRNKQPGKTTLHHRLEWVSKHATAIQTLAHAIVNQDIEGFRHALSTEIRSLGPVVGGIEMLSQHLQIPETLPMDDPKAWSVHPL